VSATCCVDEGFDAELEELLQREAEVGLELRLEDDDDDDDDVDKSRNCCLWESLSVVFCVEECSDAGLVDEEVGDCKRLG